VNDDFDLFFLESEEDITCYNYAINQEMWALHCNFLLDPYKARLNVQQVRFDYLWDLLTDQRYNNSRIIIDNTPFPDGINSRLGC